MKKIVPLKILAALLVFSFLSSSCNNSAKDPAQATGISNANSSSGDGFEEGHKLKGRYVNTDGGIRSFTFQTDGTFARGGAVSGNFTGGDYVTGSHETGTYQLHSKSLAVTYTNGDKEELPIEIFSFNNKNDYSSESPSRLKIHHVLYVQVDE